MKKLLYITVNSKPENLSASKTVGRAFVKRFLERYEEFELEELDLYECHIPRLEYEYFEDRNCMVSKDAFRKLHIKQQEEVHKIVKLADQFKEADLYVIAAPMWSMSFPAPLKEYIDCIVMDGKTVNIKSGEKPDGLLGDKQRGVVYIQSSGAHMPLLMRMVMDKGVHYIESIMKFMGIEKFEELLVDGTGNIEEEKLKAIEKAIEKIDDVIDDVWKTEI